MKLLHKIGIYRWHAATILLALAWILLTLKLLLPATHEQVRRFASAREELRSLHAIDKLPEQIAQSQSKAARLDSLLQSAMNRIGFDESHLVGMLYALADSVECKADKVEILEPVSSAGGVEIPVLFKGTGAYGAIGRFVDGVENAPYATRIRQLQVSRDDGDRGEVVVDFVVVDGSGG